jgi:hypothetical protein
MKTDKRVLFIAHRIMGTGVGLLRIRYWVNNILEESNQSVKCDLLVGDRQVSVSDTVAQVFLAPDSDKGGLLNLFIKDEGLSWKYSVKKELERRPDLNYDVVILSGGPFMHFALVPYLKERFNAKVFLDFRDPFAVNPRFENSQFKILFKSYCEKVFIKAADHILAVNASCMKLLSSYSTEKSSIISNGYDDRLLDQLSLTKQLSVIGRLRFTYIGKFYDDCRPDTFLRTICAEGSGSYSFEYAGSNTAVLNNFKDETMVTIHGSLPYRDTVRILNKADIGLIFTGGKPFESTTKIFDYIGLEKAILIITEGEVQTGELHEITHDYPKVFWSRNTESDISAVLHLLKNQNLNFSNLARQEHSRRAGLVKLINLIHGA